MNGLRLFAAFDRLDTDFLRVRHRTGYKYGGMYTGFVTFTGAGPIEVVGNVPSFGTEGSVLLGSIKLEKRGYSSLRTADGTVKIISHNCFYT